MYVILNIYSIIYSIVLEAILMLQKICWYKKLRYKINIFFNIKSYENTYCHSNKNDFKAATD